MAAGNDNASEGIKVGSGLITTIIIVSTLVGILLIGLGIANLASSKASVLTKDLSEYDVTTYESEPISGTEVINAVNKFKSAEMGVKVVTNKNTGGTWYGYTVSDSGSMTTSSSKISDAKIVSNNSYINPSGLFYGTVKRDANDTIVALIFTQK